MKKTTQSYLRLILGCIAFFVFHLVKAQSFTNPVGDLSDPHITYIEGYYYYTGTVGNRVAIKRAKTLEGLKHVELTTIFEPGDAGAQSDHFWSSEVHRIDGKWYVYYTAASQGTDDTSQRNYVIESSDANPLTRTWSFKGQLVNPSFDFYATNPTVTEINGVRYFLYAGHASADNKALNIYMSAMTNPWTLSGARTEIYTSGDLSGTLNGEAPSVLVHAGKVFLTYTVNGCGTEHGKTGLMYMDDATKNPLAVSSWTKVGTSVFDDNEQVSSFNPNHQTFFKSPDNSEVWFSYTARFDDGPWCDHHRTTRAQKLTFDGNGIPQFGTIAELGKPMVAPKGEPVLPVGTVVENGLYRIRPTAATGSQTLEIGGINIWGGANVGQWFDDTEEIHHQWYLQATEVPNEYVITSAFNGLAIEVGGCELNDFANIAMWYPSGAPCQLWSISDVGDGHYQIINKNSGKAMELGGNDGNNIYQNELDPNDNFQKFKLEFIESTLNVAKFDFVNETRLFPNPAGDFFTIKGLLNSQKNTVTITDVLGKQILKREIKDESSTIDTSSLKTGIYFISVRANDQGPVVTKKLIIR